MLVFIAITNYLVQALLVKVDSGAASYLGEVENIFNKVINVPGYSTVEAFNQTITDALNGFKVYIKSTTGNIWVDAYVNGTQEQSVLVNSGAYAPQVSLPGNTNQTLKIDLRVPWQTARNTDFELYYYTLSEIPIYKQYNYQGVPRSATLKSIGEKESTTLFGVHIDGSRVTQETD